MANPIKIKAKVVDVVKNDDLVASYRFEPQGRVPKFQPGQFLHIALDDFKPGEQWPESRVFSIASAPSTRKEELSITIAAKGKFTQRIYDTLEVGSECWLKLPYGQFTFPADKHLTLVAGGVGITPFLSLLRQMLEEKSKQDVTLYLGVRTEAHHLFLEFLEHCEAELPNFKLNLYSDDGSLSGEKGRLDIDRIYSDTPSRSTFYLSGPLDMIQRFRQRLLNLGIHPDHIMVDDWE